MINSNWNFESAVKNIKALKDKYISLLASFSIYEAKQKRMTIQNIRTELYKLKFEEWKKDKLWEYMNSDIPYSILAQLGNRQKIN